MDFRWQGEGGSGGKIISLLKLSVIRGFALSRAIIKITVQISAFEMVLPLALIQRG